MRSQTVLVWSEIVLALVLSVGFALTGLQGLIAPLLVLILVLLIGQYAGKKVS